MSLKLFKFQILPHLPLQYLVLQDDVSGCTTVWKFQDFAITQILREINFLDSKSAKLVILAHLEALNFYLYEFLHFLKAEI